ncbi:putative transmembrane protein [Paratrimastix pyriformis]|uniref:Glycerophosphocholine acyltransferase 1 n=1 Tax=Paratrimastix pyriformis TaxID=342808 RepID=A0ABQ8UH50_9EUKA|nr:putative transmembrane protein [Paratrimastix pyriformis]
MQSTDQHMSTKRPRSSFLVIRRAGRPRATTRTKILKPELFTLFLKILGETRLNLLRKVDKISFFLGTFVVMFTEYIFLKHPILLPPLYVVLIIPLLIYRFINYRRRQLQYFLIDLCYFANAILMAYVVFFPTCPILFQVCFVFSNGPLIWAIPAWHNSLVFHDIDKITSLFVHAFPTLVTFCLRWFAQDRYITCSGITREQLMGWWECVPIGAAWFLPMASQPPAGIPLGTYSPGDMLLWSIFGYVVWQMIYWTKIVSDRKFLEAHEEILTSERWFSRFQTKPPMWDRLPAHLQRSVYILIHTAFFLVTAFTTPFLFNHYWFHVFVLVVPLCAFTGNLLTALWHGATYYMDTFIARVIRAYEESHPGHPARDLVAASPTNGEAPVKPQANPSAVPLEASVALEAGRLEVGGHVQIMAPAETFRLFLRGRIALNVHHPVAVLVDTTGWRREDTGGGGDGDGEADARRECDEAE